MKKPINSDLLRLAAAFSLAAMLTVAGTAHAEKADRDKPVTLEADTVTVDDSKGVHIYQGNVKITQGTLMIQGDKVVVKQNAEGFQHGTAYGNLATFRQKREGYDEYVEGWAERIEYDAKKDKVELYNKARVKRDNDEVGGSYIAYDATTEFYQVLGGGKAGATAGSTQGRVRAVIQPKKKPGAQPNAAPLPLKPSENVTNPRQD